MQCNTEYPTPLRDVNLKAMLSIRKKYNIVVIDFHDNVIIILTTIVTR